MKISCPDCAAEYQVPDEVAAPGRTVRCARCGGTWTPLSAEPAVPSEPAPMALAELASLGIPEPPSPPRPRPPVAGTPLARPVSPRSRRQERGLLRGAWLASLLALLLLGALAIGSRQQVMRAWPPSTRLYAALGLVR